MAKYFVGVNKTGDITETIMTKTETLLEDIQRQYKNRLCKESVLMELTDINLASQVVANRKDYKFDGTNIVKR